MYKNTQEIDRVPIKEGYSVYCNDKRKLQHGGISLALDTARKRVDLDCIYFELAYE